MSGRDIQEEAGLGCRFADAFKDAGPDVPITEDRVREIIEAVLAERDRKAAEIVRGLNTDAARLQADLADNVARTARHMRGFDD